MTERPSEYHFTRAALGNVTTDMTRNQMYEWLLQLIEERKTLEAEITRLRAVASAARDAGPFPIISSDEIDIYCLHCAATAQLSATGIRTHDPDCAGVRLRDALAALEGNHD